MTALLRRTMTASVFGLLTLGGAAQGPPATLPADQTVSIIQELAATRQFEQRVNEYVTLHRLLEGPLPPLQPTRDMAVVRANMRLLATRIQAARQNARQGDIITPAVGRVFERRIATCLSPEDWAVVTDVDADRDRRPAKPVDLRVNMQSQAASSDRLRAATTVDGAARRCRRSCNTASSDGHWSIWDHHADLIVDFLPRACTT